MPHISWGFHTCTGIVCQNGTPPPLRMHCNIGFMVHQTNACIRQHVPDDNIYIYTQKHTKHMRYEQFRRHVILYSSERIQRFEFLELL